MKKASSEIWREIPIIVEGKITPVTLHLAVFHNRHNWQTQLKELLGFNDRAIVLSPNDIVCSTDESFLSASELSSSLFSKSSRELFKFSLSYDKFKLICPETVAYKRGTKRRNYEVLKTNVWADVINDAFLLKHKIPCTKELRFSQNQVMVNIILHFMQNAKIKSVVRIFMVEVILNQKKMNL